MTNPQATKPHEWDLGKTGWGLIFGVSVCKQCSTVATKQAINEKCEGKNVEAA